MSQIISTKDFALPHDIANPCLDRRRSIHRGSIDAAPVFPAGLAVRQVTYQYHYGTENEYWFVLPGSQGLRVCLSLHQSNLHELRQLFDVAASGQSDLDPQNVAQAAAAVCCGDERQFLYGAVDQLLRTGKVTIKDLIKAYRETQILVR